MVDRTQTRPGKGRHGFYGWRAFGVSTDLLFTAPSLSPMGKAIYAFVTYNCVGHHLRQSNSYTAMLPLITPKQHQRTLLSLFRMVLQNAGGLVSFGMTLGDGELLRRRRLRMEPLVCCLRSHQNGLAPGLLCGHAGTNQAGLLGGGKGTRQASHGYGVPEQILHDAMSFVNCSLYHARDLPWLQYLLLPKCAGKCGSHGAADDRLPG